jgi:hypothetical protein
VTATSSTALSISASIALPGDASTSVVVGEPFLLTIEARHAKGRIALLPQSIDLGDRLGERTAAREHSRATIGEEEIDLYRLELIAFEPGEITVPSIPLAVGSTTAKTSELTVSVRSTLSEDEAKVASSTLAQAMPELESMAAPDPAPEGIVAPDYTVVWVLAIAALLGVLALAAVRLKKRKRERAVEAPPPPPPRPAHEIALEKLALLEAAGHPKEDALKEFFSAISEILREYAGGRYGFDSLELTVDELMEALLPKQADGLDRERLRNLLVRADLVKFAKYRPTREEAVDVLAASRAIVDATKPKEAA